MHEQYIVDLARSLIPVRMEAIWGTITGVAGMAVTAMIGQWNNALEALAVFMLLDYISGVMAAYLKPRSKLSSKKGLKGIVKKLALISFVVFAHYLDIVLGQEVFMTLVVYAMLGNEGLSILENLSYCGVPIPATVKNKLEQLAAEQAERGGKDGIKKS